MNATSEGVWNWLETATKGIRFGPDRRAAERKLWDHLEDKTADFQRIFPYMTREEAEERALGEMGTRRRSAGSWPAFTSSGWGICGRSASWRNLYDGVRLDRDPVLLLPPNGQGEQVGQYQLATLYCPRGPEGAVRVSLTLTCRYDMVARALDDGRLGETLDSKTDTLTFEAEKKADDWGVYPLALGAENTEAAIVLYKLLEGGGYQTDENGSWERICSIDKAEYQMKFYQADGSLLLEHRGTIPT